MPFSLITSSGTSHAPLAPDHGESPRRAGELPTLTKAKDQAKRLRAGLAESGTDLSHAQALELLAHQHGFRDWNTFHAAIGNRPPEDWAPGGRVTGSYLSQPFVATILSVGRVQPGWFCLVLDLEEAVDVVAFDSFSNFRKRIRGIVGPQATSRERTSDGQPHLVLDL